MGVISLVANHAMTKKTLGVWGNPLNKLTVPQEKPRDKSWENCTRFDVCLPWNSQQPTSNAQMLSLL
eukprot:scaffold2679_cov85-Cyclotella_meneghiniana.AAC.5